MTNLIVRRLLVDLQTPLPRHWCAGDAFRTAWFNALSMSFPFGEQFFIDSVRAGLEQLPAEARGAFEAEARAFIGQEATHRRLHGLFNEHLQRQGLVNHWQVRAQRRMQRLEGADVRAWVGITAATEHFTAILAEYLLTRPQQMQGIEPRLATLWLWHASEESEHRSTAFDLYRALDGNEYWRLRLFRLTTLYFLQRRVAPDGEQPVARRQLLACVHLGRRLALPVRARGPAAGDGRPLAALPAQRFSSRPAGRRAGRGLVARSCAAVRGGWPASLNAGAARHGE